MVRIDFKRLRFLVIDDNAHMRRILRTMCTWFGTREVYEAEDGATGLEAFTDRIRVSAFGEHVGCAVLHRGG
jgi:CheY-like chemotaxis protein